MGATYTLVRWLICTNQAHRGKAVTQAPPRPQVSSYIPHQSKRDFQGEALSLSPGGLLQHSLPCGLAPGPSAETSFPLSPPHLFRLSGTASSQELFLTSSSTHSNTLGRNDSFLLHFTLYPAPFIPTAVCVPSLARRSIQLLLTVSSHNIHIHTHITYPSKISSHISSRKSSRLF